MENTVELVAHVDSDLAAKAALVFNRLGIDYSDAVTELCKQIVLQQSFMLELQIPPRDFQPGITQKLRSAICKTARAYGVAKVWVFGSTVQGKNRPDSDVDLIIEKGELQGVQYGGFWEDVQEAIGCRVDLLTTETRLPGPLQNAIDRDKVLVYSCD